MIGYMKPILGNQPGKKKMRRTYRIIYCSLCRCLRAEYGIRGVVALNYELVSLVLMSLALQEDEPQEEWHSCSIMPYLFVKTFNYSLPVFKKAACLSILTVWGELKDNYRDGQKFRNKAMLWLFDVPKQKAVLFWPDLYYGFSNRLMQYYLLEDTSNSYLDIMSAYDEFLSFSVGYLLNENTNGFVTENYLMLGRMLGRWIYYMDAIEDYEKDMRKKGFNPFLLENAPKGNEIVEEVNELLMHIVSQVKRLPVRRYRNLLEEICIAGLEKRTKMVLGKSTWIKNEQIVENYIRR